MRELILCFAVVAVAFVGPASMRGAGADDTRAMVAVPAGKALLGCNEGVDKECEEDEKPGGIAELTSFEIDTTEVTVAQYRACVDAKGCSSGDTGFRCAR